MKKIRKSFGTSVLKGSVVDSLDSNNSDSAPSIRAVNEKIDGIILYENTEGINSGSFTLDNWKKYKRIVFYDINGNFIGEILSEATVVHLNKIDQGSTNLYMYNARLNISGNDFTFYSNYKNIFNGASWSRDTSGLITIGKVIGYK